MGVPIARLTSEGLQKRAADEQILSCRLLLTSHFLPAKMSLEMADNAEKPYDSDEKASKEAPFENAETGKPQEELVRQEQSPEEKRLVRRLDMRILPITCLLYLFACACPISFCFDPGSGSLVS